jgi:hypothetical protein
MYGVGSRGADIRQDFRWDRPAALSRKGQLMSSSNRIGGILTNMGRHY